MDIKVANTKMYYLDKGTVPGIYGPRIWLPKSEIHKKIGKAHTQVKDFISLVSIWQGPDKDQEGLMSWEFQNENDLYTVGYVLERNGFEATKLFERLQNIAKINETKEKEGG